MILKTNITRIAILKNLMESAEKLVSSGNLSEKVNVSRQSIWKSIESLREEGFQIISIPNRGYSLVPTNQYDLSPTWVAVNTDPSDPWGKEVYVLKSIDSTQIMAKGLARKGCSNGTVVLAEEQTLGRGRMERRWNSPPDSNIYMSIVFFPQMNPSMLQLINLAAGMAILSSIKEITGIDCQLKWPNDILYDEKKLCGILSEASIESDRIHFAVTGIGINVNSDISSYPEDIRSKATSLYNITGNLTDRGILAGKITSDFHIEMAEIEKNGPEGLLDKYRKNCSTLGKDIEIITGHNVFRGKAVDITSGGEIVVLVNDRMISFSAADIVHRPYI